MAHEYIVLKRDDIELCRLAVPRRPYKNLEEFRRAQCAYRKSLIEDPTFYPCLHCGSDGWIYHPDSSPCPVEGNKMRERITCQVCRGSARGEKLRLQVAYKTAIVVWEVEKKTFSDKISHAQFALESIITEDLVALMVVLGKFERNGWCSKDKEKVKVIRV